MPSDCITIFCIRGHARHCPLASNLLLLCLLPVKLAKFQLCRASWAPSTSYRLGQTGKVWHHRPHLHPKHLSVAGAVSDGTVHVLHWIAARASVPCGQVTTASQPSVSIIQESFWVREPAPICRTILSSILGITSAELRKRRAVSRMLYLLPCCDSTRLSDLLSDCHENRAEAIVFYRA